jgi:predicted PurR-regulated permease PerM
MRSAALGDAHHTAQSRTAIAAALLGAGLMAALAVGRPFLVPLALAALFAFALEPLVTRLMRSGLDRRAATALSVLLAAALAFAIALFVSDQIALLTATVPHRADMAVLSVFREPMPVWIAGNLAEPLMNPMASVGIALLGAAAMLLNKDRLAIHTARFAAAQSGDGLASSARAFARALLVQGAVDVTFGVSIAAGLWAIGIPDPGLWALLGVMLRSVPFVGALVAAACPLMLAMSLGPSAFTVAATLVLFLGVDVVLTLAQKKLSKPAIARLMPAAAVGVTVVWTCLWGLAGLLLAVPVSLGVALIGRHFAPLAFLDHLLATPAASRRKLPFAKPCPVRVTAEAPLQELLALQRSLQRLDEGRRGRIAQAVAGLAMGGAPATAPDVVPRWRDGAVVCIAGPGTMDQVAAGLLAQALRRKGFASRVVPFDATGPEALGALDLSDAPAVCISCLDPEDYASLRRLVRRLRPLAEHARFMAGLWGWQAAQLMDAGTTECDLVASNPEEAAEQIARLARRDSRPRAEDVFAAELVPALSAEPLAA